MRNGFSLLELLLGVFITAIAILGVIALSLSLLRGDRKAVDTSAAQAVADHVVSAQVYAVENDLPAGKRSDFWDHDYPQSGGGFLVGDYEMNRTQFHYQIDAVTVVSGSSTPLGSGVSHNRLKRVEVHLTWKDAAGNGNRQGSGMLRYDSVRLVHEKAAP